jgi:hypothetical protein
MVLSAIAIVVRLSLGRGTEAIETFTVVVAALALGLTRLGLLSSGDPPPVPETRSARLRPPSPGTQHAVVDVDLLNTGPTPWWLDSIVVRSLSGHVVARGLGPTQIPPNALTTARVDVPAGTWVWQARDASGNDRVHRRPVTPSEVLYGVDCVELVVRASAPFDRLVRRISLARTFGSEDRLDPVASASSPQDACIVLDTSSPRFLRAERTRHVPSRVVDVRIGDVTPDEVRREWTEVRERATQPCTARS